MKLAPRNWTSRRQGRDLIRCAHPKQAVLFAIIVGSLAAADGRPALEVAFAATAVLTVQLALGLDNDLADQQHDYRAQTEGKPIAAGRIDAATVSYWMMVLLLLSVPLAAGSGITAGAALLATLPLGWLHNHRLHRTAFSFVGWMLSFALVPAFLAYGGLGGRIHGSAPSWAVTAAAAAVGLAYHFASSLGDLVTDNKSGARNLPLRIALRIGAPRLLLFTIALVCATVAALVLAGLGVGLRQ